MFTYAVGTADIAVREGSPHNVLHSSSIVALIVCTYVRTCTRTYVRVYVKHHSACACAYNEGWGFTYRPRGTDIISMHVVAEVPVTTALVTKDKLVL